MSRRAGLCRVCIHWLAIGACPVENSDDRFYTELRPVGERVDPPLVSTRLAGSPAGGDDRAPRT